jgi:hypothetical protein
VAAEPFPSVPERTWLIETGLDVHRMETRARSYAHPLSTGSRKNTFHSLSNLATSKSSAANDCTSYTAENMGHSLAFASIDEMSKGPSLTQKVRYVCPSVLGVQGRYAKRTSEHTA